MKLYSLILFVITTALLISCKKEIETPQETEKITNITIDGEKKAHFNKSDQRYETETFDPQNQSFFYSFQPTESITYRILIYGLNMAEIDLRLTKNGQLVDTGAQANVAFTSKFISYQATNEDEVIIEIENLSDDNIGKSFILTVEEIGTYVLSWKGYDWLCDGDWEVNELDQMVFKGNGSGFTKWIRLLEPIDSSYSATTTFSWLDTGDLDFVGMTVEASDEIDLMTNLPNVARQFKTNNEDWELWSIDLGNNGGINREVDEVQHTSDDFIVTHTLSAKIDSSTISFDFNTNNTTTTPGTSSHKDYFYITVEEVNYTQKTFRSFEIE